MPVIFFHRTWESNEYTVLTHIGVWVKTKIKMLYPPCKFNIYYWINKVTKFFCILIFLILYFSLFSDNNRGNEHLNTAHSTSRTTEPIQTGLYSRCLQLAGFWLSWGRYVNLLFHALMILEGKVKNCAFIFQGSPSYKHIWLIRVHCMPIRASHRTNTQSQINTFSTAIIITLEGYLLCFLKGQGHRGIFFSW